MNNSDFERLSDKELLSVLLHVYQMSAIANTDNDAKQMSARLVPILEKCVENMRKVDELMSKLIETNDNLGMERATNKRRLKLLGDFTVFLSERPELYPPPLDDLVRRLHKETR